MYVRGTCLIRYNQALRAATFLRACGMRCGVISLPSSGMTFFALSCAFSVLERRRNTLCATRRGMLCLNSRMLSLRALCLLTLAG